MHVTKDATIMFGTNFDDYLPHVRVRWEGTECYNYSPLVYAYKKTNIALTGTGTLNGQAESSWAMWPLKLKPGTTTNEELRAPKTINVFFLVPYMLLLFDMVDIETVLVLGAGASKAFGLPIGKELVRDIYSMLDTKVGGFRELFWEVITALSLGDAGYRLVEALRDANPLSIDSWLEHNPSFIEVGKAAIAIALLYKEQKSDLRPQRNWYQLLFKRLDGPFEEFQNNKLSIITFNYDRSLEQYLFGTFKYTHTERTEEKCREKLNQLRILHVYGSLGRLEWQSDIQKPTVSYGQSLNRATIISAAKSIKIIPRPKQENVVLKSVSDEFNEARKLIAGANALYFLGFGYNQTNMERLGIETLKKTLKNMGTAKDLGYQEFQEIKRMNIFRKVARTYSGQTLQTRTVDNQIEHFLFDKTVYEFLHGHVDFNSL